MSIVFDRCFMVNDIKIIQGRDGLFISMPSRKKKNGEFKDVAHPLNNETRQMIERDVVAEYERVLAERGEELPAPPRTFPVATDEAEAEPAAPAPAPAPVAAETPVAAAETPAAEAEAPVAAAAANGGSAEEAPAVGAEPAKRDEDPNKSLEEIQEMHLRDSFWSVS